MKHTFPYAGLTWIIFICTLSVFAPQLSLHDPVQPIAAPLAAPRMGILLGTDHLGRDLLSRLIFGGRFSLIAAGLAALITIVVGSGIGFLASMLEGWMQRLFLQIINASLAIPGILFAMLLVSGLGTGLQTVVLQLELEVHLVSHVCFMVSAAPFGMPGICKLPSVWVPVEVGIFAITSCPIFARS